jgi:quinol monooxygenase YgiN
MRKVMLTVILDMTFTETGLQGFVANARAGLPDTRNFPGCLGLTVLQDIDDPHSITFYERWASRQDYDKYLAWRGEQGLMDALNTQSAVPPRWRYFEEQDY